MEKKEYTLFSLIEIRFADPISAIAISNNFLIIGSIMGRIILQSLEDGKTVLISELSTENISGISFSNDEYSFFVAIGDEQVLKFPSDTSIIGPIKRILNYPNEKEHNIHCENSFIFLNSNFLFKILLSPPEEGNITIINYNADFEIKNLNNDYCEKGSFSMTNYSVPLDFDIHFFVWVEFLSQQEKNLCVANLDNLKEKPIKKLFKRDFGHISHCKIYPKNKIFLVRNFNICEIIEINHDFSLVNSFVSFGDEVYAIDIFFEHEQRIFIRNEIEKNYIGNKNNSDIFIQPNKNIPTTNNNIINKNIKNENINLNNICIYLLDINGNVNLWDGNKIKILFNLYDIENINQVEKNKKFFSMGYSYYIKCNKNFICITTDHGCYVIKKLVE
jgi:hypothetical protein